MHMRKGLILPQMELESGLIVENVFVRIDTVSGNINSITIDVKLYASKDFFEQGKPYIKENVYEFEHDSSESAYNVFKQGYMFLKTLPGFEDARDA